MKVTTFLILFLVTVRSSLAYDITTDTLWSGDHRVTESVTILDGATLTIDAGTTVEVPTNAFIRVEGRILAEGTEATPIIFTRYNHHTGANRWGKIRLADADGLNRFVWCEFWYTNGSANSAEGNEGAVSMRGTHALLEDCTFTTTVGDSVNIWDGSTATLRRCYLGPGGEGVHGDNSDIEEDSCTFAYREGRYDASDIQAQGHNVWVHHCLFLGSNLDDGADFDNCNGIVEHCWFFNYLGIEPGWEGRCGGVTMNDASQPLVRNNVFINCRQGIIAKGRCRPYITNCDFVDCENGVAAYEAGEAPGRQVGFPTIRNCIMWRTTNTLVLGYDSNLGTSSTVDIDYCDVWSTETLYADDSQTTVGPNIFSADPMFVDGVDGGDGWDLHLTAGSPCIDTGENGVDVGAFPFDSPSAVVRWRRY